MTFGPPLRMQINVAALAGNWRLLAEKTGPATCAGVVKADAYGLGVEIAVPALAGAGCATFFVATPAEGIEVRALAPDAAIYVLDGLLGAIADYATHQLRPVLGSPDALTAWCAFRDTLNSDAGRHNLVAALHVDTGMNRLGLTMAEAIAIAAETDTVNGANRAGIGLLMSHFACADTPNHPLNLSQIDRFAAVRGLFPALPGSLANSAGIFLRPEAHHDQVRPGIALYGGASHPAATLANVVSAQARIVQIRSAPSGESVGYGATQFLKRDSRLAIVAAGYGDGYPRAAGSGDDRPGASVAIGGHIAPLAGRVSMDLIAVNVTDLPENAVQVGAYAELFGPTIAIDDVARHAGTIGYELLTNLSRRAVREVIAEGENAQ